MQRDVDFYRGRFERAKQDHGSRPSDMIVLAADLDDLIAAREQIIRGVDEQLKNRATLLGFENLDVARNELVAELAALRALREELRLQYRW